MTVEEALKYQYTYKELLIEEFTARENAKAAKNKIKKKLLIKEANSIEEVRKIVHGY